MAAPVLSLTDRGFSARQGNFLIDRWATVDRALITHASCDHVQGRGTSATFAGLRCMPGHCGHRRVTSPGHDRYGEARRESGCLVKFPPRRPCAGIGVQIRVDVAGEVLVVSGDYKTEPDGLLRTFQPVALSHFISELNLRLAVVSLANTGQLLATKIQHWWADNVAQGVASLLRPITLGSGSVFCHLLDPADWPES